MFVKGLLPVTVSVAALVFVAPDAHAQEMPAKYALDFPCAADLFPGTPIPKPRRGFRIPGADKIPGADRLPGVDKLLPEPNAVCRAQGLMQLLMLTGRTIDRAAYSAAKGVDAVQLALGRQRTLLGPIAEFERAAGGLGFGDPDKTEVVIRQTSEASRQLQVEIAQMKDSMRNDPEVLKNLQMAHASLNEVEYYSITATIGGTLFGRAFSAASNQERAQLALSTQQAGLAMDFAEKLPARSGRVRSVLADTFALRGGISTVVKNTEPEGDGAKRAKNQAKADLEAQQSGRIQK